MKAVAKIGLAFTWLITACNPVYFPNSLNSPMLQSKGELQIAGAAGSGGLELQSAYAISPSIGVMFNGAFISNSKRDTISQFRSLVELGIGYATPMTGRTRFECFVGGGGGKVPADFRNTSYYGQSSSMNRLFIQPAVGITSRMADVSVAVRGVAVTANHETNLFIEPAIITRIGYQNIRFTGCIGVSHPLTDYENRTWDHNPFIFSLGVQYRFGGSPPANP